MVKNKVIVSLFVCLFFFGCKKNSTPAPAQINAWTFDNLTYVVTSSARVDFSTGGKSIAFYANAQGSKAKLYVIFKSLPIASGNYQLVDAINAIGDNQCFVEGTDSSGFIFYPYIYNTPEPPVLAVTLNANSKISISIPEITISYQQPSSTYKLKGTLYEK
ncbi:hypothetical protein [Mucilaginibacter flavus]|uniref:hypothetical protein n=1 Tax=Mucilaginibacter flavus TaxID=931504 RepID=UPI0025B60A6C|nr:hypothetical protein [Mucilaginibacter flavus]MDN3581849.1 hypothetical protein [Mucilaginibacter flavus]